MWMLVLTVILAKMVEFVCQLIRDQSVTVPRLISRVSSVKKVGSIMIKIFSGIKRSALDAAAFTTISQPFSFFMPS